MIERYVLEYAVEALVNEGLEGVIERWDCSRCGQSFIKISCAKPHCRQDLLLKNEHNGKGWKVFAVVYPEYRLEISCECEENKNPLRVVRDERDS